MSKTLLRKIGGIIFLIFLFLITPEMLPAQVKSNPQADDPATDRPITGHNNLRKLAKISDQQAAAKEGKPTSVGDDAQLRRLYELEMLKDPATGEIPEGIREKELAFAERMYARMGKASRANSRVIDDWHPRGPFNVGGRTRALAIDLDNENIILAGGVSGGMWRSDDSGLTWSKTTGSSEIQSVTAVVQDPRPGFRHIWYYSTGERIGNSASGASAIFSGNGIFKSTDGGRSWNVLPVTADNKPQAITPFDMVFNLAIHPTTGDLYVATFAGVRRSTDGGATFTVAIAGGTDVWGDVMITPNGVIYVSLDSDGNPNRGIFRSTDGNTWTNITPVGIPFTTGSRIWGRIVLTYTPSDENIIYAYADDGVQTGRGFLWRYNYSETSPVWTSLSGNLPAFGGQVGNLNTQTGYNMVIKVHPSDPNIIFIGGTNLYRSTNGFTSSTGTVWLGGYSPANNVSVYHNQHPDQHVLLFYPSNPSRALAATDGGIHRTENVLALNPTVEPVSWESLNNGYLTTQPYTVSFDPKGTNEHLMAGFQDNGTWFTNTTALNTAWSEEFSGDGSYNMFADGGLTRYVSSQGGNIYRINYPSADATIEEYTSFTRVRPAGATGFGFIAPFVLDPNNDNIMYLPAGPYIWRNDDLDGIPLFSNQPASTNWNQLLNTAVPPGHNITALTVSHMPANRLYYGTNGGVIMRVDHANIGDQPKTDISTGKGLPTGYVNCIAVDPANADRVFVVFSNYNIQSVFYSADGGKSWTNISGNLEESPSGVGNGPSARWLAIEGNSDRYYLGTSTGLYSTVTLDGANTVWTKEAVNGIGNVVVPMVSTRDDGFVAVATHGNGVYSGKFEVTPLPQPKLSIVNPISDLELIANSPNTMLDISKVFKNTGKDSITFSIFNTNPTLISAKIQGNLLVLSYKPDAVGKGLIGVIAKAGHESIMESFNVTISNVNYALYNQNTPKTEAVPSQLFIFGGIFAILAQSADDFEIPAGQTWIIEKVAAPGAVNGAPILNSAIVEIYSDNLNKPGTRIYTSGALTPVSATSNPNLELALATPVTLPAGRYWISVYARLAFTGGNQWFWATTATVKGNPGHFIDPSDLFEVGATTWKSLHENLGVEQSDLLFTLYGKGTGITNMPIPAAPANLGVLYSSNTKFDLSWTDASTDEIGFQVERSTDGVNFAKRTLVGPNKTSYADTDFFDPLLTYYYRVAAMGISDLSAYSNIDSTAIIPAAPHAKLATFVSSKSFIANWEPVPGARHYVLEASADDFATTLPGYSGKMVTGTSHFVQTKKYHNDDDDDRDDSDNDCDDDDDRDDDDRDWDHKSDDDSHHKSDHNSKSDFIQYRLRAANAGGESSNSNTIVVTSIKNLKLAAVCSDDPSRARRWKITNPNPFDIEVDWLLHHTSQRDSIIAPPGESYFFTQTDRKLNTVIITWLDDKLKSHVLVKSSTHEKCKAHNRHEVYGREGWTGDGIETDSPFIIDAWPNPTNDKWNILIASPYEEAVDLNIIDTKGNRVFNLKTHSNIIIEVDATEYTSGMYLLKAQQLMFQQTLKLLKR